ncbi:hypothetical protein NP233_g9301 [Leucocoprinus birnbaumii]|uniref:PPP4R2-domain-containing protein n=1 Tax=Leucocoprinus birnbaumii TaxID=56174 RepID=A0AAD5VKT9_9AGAR|nr:hypothetical protein NP233_g9301 [Leucocoprinus birnbaumii]
MTSPPPPSTAFEWKEEHQALLEKLASTDTVEADWPLIRDVVKHKVEENIKLYLTTTKPTPPPPHFNQVPTPNGGLKIAPFPPHKTVRVHLNEKPTSFMRPEEAEEAKKYIFEQLDGFDSTYYSVPFSIQRLCELCVKPREHYKSIGKYLRAVEKSILVTSTTDAFPPLTEEEKDSFGRGATMLGSTRQSAPATPLFSPIPFLHEDARRSQSASPPPSPLALTAVGSISDAHIQPLQTKALGLVDEMDDPGPGHLREHPQAISAVTDLGREHQNTGATTSPSAADPGAPKGASASRKQSSPPPQQTSAASNTSSATTGPGTARPLFGGSLEQRFVRAGLTGPASDTMVVDDDKENSQSK